MNTLSVSRAHEGAEFLGKLPKFPSDSDYDRVITAPARLVDADTGEVVASLFEAPAGHAELRRALRRVKCGLADRTSGMFTRARTFGAMPRRPLRQNFCNRASLDNQQPAEFEVLERWGEKASAIVRSAWPDAWERSEAFVQSIPREWTLSGEIFTSGIVNQTTALRYHRDRGNFKDNVSAMYVFKRDCDGGHLVLPEYRVALAFDKPSILVFEGQNVVHGVSPLRLRSNLGYRYSLVYFAMKGLLKCGTCSEELDRIRTLRAAKEAKRAATPPKDKPEGE